MPYYPWMNCGTGYMGLWAILSLVLSALLIALAVWVVMRLARSSQPADTAGARRILDERLARGEIDVEEYRTRRAMLSG